MDRIKGECPLGSECESIVSTAEGKKLKVCPWFVKVRGIDPQTGAEVDQNDCAIAWIPVLLIENSSMQRQTGAAVESFRNEMVKQNVQLITGIVSRTEKALELDN